MVVSKSQQYWQDVIDQYYTKYKGLYATHMKYLQEVNKTGKLRSPLGREYEFKRNKRGEFSEYEITNYPNQGLGADVMAVARVSLAARFSKYKLRSLLISTIHDSLTSDSPDDEVQTVKEIMVDVFTDLPKNIEKSLGIPWNLPMCGEISVGPNMKDLT